MPSSIQLAAGDKDMLAVVQRCRKLLNRRALMGAAASTVPVPGLDWLVDAALLSKLLPAINAEFGLTPEQLDRLPKHKREQVQKAVGVVGSMLIGKLVTRDMVVRVASVIGTRLTAKQAAKYVPLAGQAVSAIIGYTAIRYLGEAHIKDCVEVCQRAGLPLPMERALEAPPA
jgi:uncharacterized protein (DUF697 family)